MMGPFSSMLVLLQIFFSVLLRISKELLPLFHMLITATLLVPLRNSFRPSWLQLRKSQISTKRRPPKIAISSCILRRLPSSGDLFPLFWTLFFATPVLQLWDIRKGSESSSILTHFSSQHLIELKPKTRFFFGGEKKRF